MNPSDAKVVLTQLKEEIAARVERTHQHVHQRQEPVSAKFSEQSVEMDNQELVLNPDAEGKDELRQIEAALTRIEKGKYGLCVGCGEEINPDRLEAIPFAAQCIGCANQS